MSSIHDTQTENGEWVNLGYVIDIMNVLRVDGAGECRVQ